MYIFPDCVDCIGREFDETLHLYGKSPWPSGLRHRLANPGNAGSNLTRGNNLTLQENYRATVTRLWTERCNPSPTVVLCIMLCTT